MWSAAWAVSKNEWWVGVVAKRNHSETKEDRDKASVSVLINSPAKPKPSSELWNEYLG